MAELDVRGQTLRTRYRLRSRNPLLGLPPLFVRFEQPRDVELVVEGIERLEFRVRRGVVEVHARTTGKEAPWSTTRQRGR